MRWKRFQLSNWFFNFMVHGWELSHVTSDAPADLKIVGAQWEHLTATIIVTVESATFDEVGPGEVIPDWSPSFTAHRPDFAALVNIINMPD